jgi:hypothetical protein
MVTLSTEPTMCLCEISSKTRFAVIESFQWLNQCF